MKGRVASCFFSFHKKIVIDNFYRNTAIIKTFSPDRRVSSSEKYLSFHPIFKIVASIPSPNNV